MSSIINLKTKESSLLEELESFSLEKFDVNQARIDAFSKKVSDLFGDALSVNQSLKYGIVLTGHAEKLKALYDYLSDSEVLKVTSETAVRDFSYADTKSDVTLLKAKRICKQLLLASTKALSEAEEYVTNFNLMDGKKRKYVDDTASELLNIPQKLQDSKEKCQLIAERLRKMLPDFADSILSVEETKLDYRIFVTSKEVAEDLNKTLKKLLDTMYIWVPRYAPCCVEAYLAETKEKLEVLLMLVPEKDVLEPKKAKVEEVREQDPVVIKDKTMFDGQFSEPYTSIIKTEPYFDVD